jgi:nucleolar GTP-binding protein
MYFMDLSEQCGYSVSDQIKLFHSIRPLFANKLVFIVVNKIDVRRPEDLEPELQEEMQKMLKTGDVEMLQLSCTTTEGVTDVKNAACDKLLAERVAQKLKSGSNNAGTPGGRLGDVLARIHVAQPMGGVQRETFIPDAVKGLQKYDKNDPNRKRLERDIEEENGGAGVYNIDLKKTYTLADDDWKHDKIPEVWNGKNIYDYVDPDIEAKLAALEEEEEKLEADGYYESDESVEDAEDADTRMKADLIREKRTLMRNEAKLRKSLKNRAAIPRSAKAKRLSQMEHALDAAGYDGDAAVSRARSQSQARGRTSTRGEMDTGDAMDVDQNDPKLAIARAKVRARSQAATDRLHDGVTNETARSKAERLTKLGQKKMNRMARQGEADRHQTVSLTKHLVRYFQKLSIILYYTLLTNH